jgi:S-adenosylmethionine:tRNA-ribosyltransferase-isomerase (queuine synthetase)
MSKMKLSEFDFDLPEELVANYPSENRDESRLMVIHRETGLFFRRRRDDHEQHTRFSCENVRK